MPLDPLIGRIIAGRYRLNEVIGHGGMGVVYCAEQAPLGRRVVVKVMRQDAVLDPVAARRFENEARVVATLNHPHVVTVHDFGQESDGLYYLVMERLRGRTLHEVICQGPLSWPLATEVMRQIALALQAAHANDIVHRDLKPANIFLLDDPGRRTLVKVLDFGLARRLDNDTSSRSNALGTHAYMSPEQLLNELASSKSDCYAAGVVWYELLTGINPFRADTLPDTLNRHLQLTPAPPSSLQPSIPPDVDAAVLRLLVKNPTHRPSTTELLDELDVLLADASATPPVDATRRVLRTPPPPPGSRLKQGVLTAALLTSVSVLLLAFPATTAAMPAMPAPALDHKSLAGLPPAGEFDPAVVNLGRRLYFDPRLSSNGTISCDTCHPLDQGGTTFEARTQRGTSHKVVKWNTTTIFNANHAYRQTWLADVPEIEEVIDRPLTDLMGPQTWDDILTRLRTQTDYPALFEAIGLHFDEPSTKKAIATWVRFVEPRNSAFDLWDTEDKPLDKDAAHGLELFNDFGCIGCHQGRGVGGNMMARLGAVADPYTDRGVCADGSYCRSDAGCQLVGGGLCSDRGKSVVRAGIDDGADGKFMFRVPSLRNVGVTAPYFHDGSARTLPEAVATMARLQLGRTLADDDVKAITAFLNSLTGVVDPAEIKLGQQLRVSLR